MVALFYLCVVHLQVCIDKLFCVEMYLCLLLLPTLNFHSLSLINRGTILIFANSRTETAVKSVIPVPVNIPSSQHPTKPNIPLCVQTPQFLKLLESKNILHHWKESEKLAQKMVWFTIFGYVVTRYWGLKIVKRDKNCTIVAKKYELLSNKKIMFKPICGIKHRFFC